MGGSKYCALLLAVKLTKARAVLITLRMGLRAIRVLSILTISFLRLELCDKRSVQINIYIKEHIDFCGHFCLY